MTQLYGIRVFCLFLIAGLIAGTSSGQEVDYFHEQWTVPLTISEVVGETSGNTITHLQYTLPTPIAVSAEDPAFLEMDFDSATSSFIANHRCLCYSCEWGPEQLIIRAHIYISFHDGYNTRKLWLAPSYSYDCEHCQRSPTVYPRKVTPNAPVNLANHLTSGDEVFNIDAISVKTWTVGLYIRLYWWDHLRSPEFRPVSDLGQVEASVQLEGLRSIRVFGVNQPPAVVLIHGWNGSNDSWGGDTPNLKTLLEEEGRVVKYFSFNSANWNISIATLAGRLADSLDAWSDNLAIDELGVDIIAHSMGGLIARYFIAHPEFTYADRVKKLITLGTPNNGAAPAHFSDLLPGTIQGTQMKYGSVFLWNLREDWLASSPETEVLCIAGARNYTDPHDGIVRIPSASLQDLGYPVCYIPNPHSGEAGDLNHIGMAYIKDANHPSYIAISSFLDGTAPPSNENSVNHLTDGMLILGLFDQANNPVGVGSFPFPLELPKVWWTPNPHLYCCWPINWGVNNDSYPVPGYGKYFATGADPGDYLLEIHPRGGYTYLFDSPVSIYPRQAQIVSLTVESADESAPMSFAEGDTEPFAFGNTGVTIDFSSGPGGEVWVHRFIESAPATDYTTLPYYWNVISDMANGSFNSTLIFGYDESDLLSAGLIEDELVVAYYDNLWHPIGGEVDPVANTVSVTTSHLTLFGIGDFPAPGSICASVNLGGDPVLPSQGVTVTVLDQNNDPVGEPLQTDEYGEAVFEPIEIGEYSVMIVTPLSYSVSPAETQTNIAVVSSECTPVEFLLTPTVVTNDCRTIGYWKHQFNVYTSSRGNAQESVSDLDTYLDLVHQHFDILGVYVDLENFDFEDAKNVLTVRGGSSMTERTKQQLFALLLNFASARIGNETIISDDGQVAAEAVTLVADLITDSDPENDETAKTICDLINNGRTVDSGIIPESPIRYKFEPENMPQTFSVGQNFPNPFNAQTTIQYRLPEAVDVEITIYNPLGQREATLFDGVQQAGVHTITWDADDQPSGIYFYKVQAGDNTETRKMVLLK